MNIEEIENRLIGHLAAILSVQADEIAPDASLEALGVASMALVEMFVFIEKEFGLELMSAGLEREDLATVHSLAQAVARNI
ncbi:MAG: acyl carrier protein [Kiritimatiellales bacterium]|nr:acyl carrier protein [Kiritimatiellales bacterium]